MKRRSALPPRFVTGGFVLLAGLLPLLLPAAAVAQGHGGGHGGGGGDGVGLATGLAIGGSAILLVGGIVAWISWSSAQRPWTRASASKASPCVGARRRSAHGTPSAGEPEPPPSTREARRKNR